MKFVKGVEGNYVGCDVVVRNEAATTESCENNFLGRAGNHAGILGEGGSFGSANPVRHGDFLETHFQAEPAQFRGDVFGGSAGLGRAAGARSDILGQVRELAVGIFVIERGGFNGGKLLQEQWRKVLAVLLGHLGGSRPRRHGFLRRVLRTGCGRKERKRDQNGDKAARNFHHR
jgi:hypothetical protein